MTQSSPPSHDGSAAINYIYLIDQKLKLIEHCLIGQMQADASRDNKAHNPCEISKTGRSLDFLPLAGDNP